ncbi:MAG: RNA polymerase sigma factor [Flavobacteriaceae bacterium]
MSRLTDLEILIKIKTGDILSFSLLVDRYKYLVYTAAFRMLKVKEDAEEVSQDVFLSAFKALDTFRGDSKFSTWLYRITYRKCLDYLKKNQRWIDNKGSDISEYHDIGELDKRMEDLEQQERKLQVRKAIGELPGDDGLLITLFYLEELTLKEIAEITGYSPNSLKVKLFRSRKRLLSLLKKEMEPEIIQKYGG